MARKTFKLVDGTLAHNFKELALLLGVDKVTRADISEGGQYSDMVEILEMDTPVDSDDEASEEENTTTTDETEEANPTDTDEESKEEATESKEEDTESKEEDTESKEEDTTKEDVSERPVYTAISDSDLEGVTKEEILESLPGFRDLSDLKNYIKDIDTPTLEFTARGLGLTWSPTYHASIHRMRMALAMQHYFFPELFVPKSTTKNKAKYGDYSTVDLEKLARGNKVKWSKSDNERINRMRVITALKASGFLPQ